MNSREILIQLALQFNNNWNDIYHYIQNGKEPKGDLVPTYGDDVRVFTLVDEDYPESFKSVAHPFFTLFCRGNTDLLKDGVNRVTYLGPRDTNDVIDSYIGCVDVWDKNICLVVSSSCGLNRKLLESAVGHQKVILVLANGINGDGERDAVPQELVDKILDNEGLIISAIPTTSALTKEMIDERNRLVGIISTVVVGVYVRRDTGSASIIQTAIANNKDVFMFPLSLDIRDDVINNLCIKEGASIYTAARDLREFLKKGGDKDGE